MALPGGALLGVTPTATPNSLILFWTTRASKEDLLGGPPITRTQPLVAGQALHKIREGGYELFSWESTRGFAVLCSHRLQGCAARGHQEMPGDKGTPGT